MPEIPPDAALRLELIRRIHAAELLRSHTRATTVRGEV